MQTTVPRVAFVDRAIRHVQKLWGYETIFVNNTLYCGKILTVLPNGNACSIHYHKNKTETFYVLSGELALEVFLVEDTLKASSKPMLLSSWILKPGDSVTIPPLSPHRFWAIQKVSEFIEVSTMDMENDSYRLVPAGPWKAV